MKERTEEGRRRRARGRKTPLEMKMVGNIHCLTVGKEKPKLGRSEREEVLMK